MIRGVFLISELTATEDRPMVCDGGIPDDDSLVSACDAEQNVDPNSDARRGEPLVTNLNGDQRIWATGWYRVQPRTFVHHELFFTPDQIACVYAEESYKSYLLRRSRRELEAARVGRSHLYDRPEELVKHNRSFSIPTTDIESVQLRSGTLLFKPKMVIRTSDTAHVFYHWRRRQNIAALAAMLRNSYTFDVAEK